LQDLGHKQINLEIEGWFSFENLKEKGLGVPLPAGLATVYSQGPDNSVELLGVTDIKTTKVGRKIFFKVPSSMTKSYANPQSPEVNPMQVTKNLRADLIQTEFKTLSDKIIEANYILNLENKNAEDAEIEVRLSLPNSNSKILKESINHTLEGVNQYVWKINIPARSKSELKYRIQIEME